MAEAHKIEKGKEYSFVKSNEEENGAVIRAVEMPLDGRSSEYLKNGSSRTNRWCYKSDRREWVITAKCSVILTMTFIIIIILIPAILFAAFASPGRRNERCPDLLPADPCPNDWLGYQMKCYYFSTFEGNWTSGNRHCSSHNASLAMVDSQETLDFFLRYKSPPDHWIGLQKDSGQPWRWINGSIFTEWFFTLPTEMGRRCAYLNHKAVASSSCTREERWICSKDMFKSIAEIEP